MVLLAALGAAGLTMVCVKGEAAFDMIGGIIVAGMPAGGIGAPDVGVLPIGRGAPVAEAILVALLLPGIMTPGDTIIEPGSSLVGSIGINIGAPTIVPPVFNVHRPHGPPQSIPVSPCCETHRCNW
jgi:hypothetical protein